MIRRVGVAIRTHPVTPSVLVIVLALTLATGAENGASPAVRAALGVGPAAFIGGAAVFSPITAGLVADGLAALLVSLVGILVLLGASERALGSWRALTAYLVSGLLGVVSGQILLQVAALISGGGEEPVVLDPLTPVIGAAFAATSVTSRLWRRRFRIGGMAVLFVLVLYSGEPVDVYRLCAGFAGIIVGLAFGAPPHGLLHISRSSHHEARGLLAGLVLLVAVGPLVTLVTGTSRGPLHPLAELFDPTPTRADACDALVATADCVRALAMARLDGVGPVLVALVPLALLALTVVGLLRGRRAAAWIAATILLLFAGLELLYTGLLRLFPDAGQLTPDGSHPAALIPDLLSVTVPLGLGIALLANLRRFPARPSARATRRFFVILGSAAVGAASVYVVVGAAVAAEFRPPVTVLSLLIDLPERFVPVGYLHLRALEFAPEGPIATLVYSGVGAAFWLAALVASGLLFADVAGRGRSTDLSRIRVLLRDGASGTLSHMALWQGNSYWFTPDDGGAIAYRVVSGVAVTTGGPIGPRTKWDEIVTGFVAHCDVSGWVPAFYSVSDEVRSRLAELGWSSTEIGDDAVLDPATFTLAGGRWKDVRTSVNRAAKLGVVAQWTTWGDLPVATRTQVAAISEEWVAGRNLPEMGFTLGGVDELDDPEVRLMLAQTADGAVLAATSWMPTYRAGVVVGWTLDFMRRRTDAMNGVTEFLIAETVRRAAREGREFVSLSAAPLSRVADPTPDQGVAAHVLGYVGRRLELLYGFRSLLTFKQKFAPDFRPLSIAYPDPLVLPAIGMALMRAYLPSMTMPQVVTLMRRAARPAPVATSVPDPLERVPTP